MGARVRRFGYLEVSGRGLVDWGMLWRGFGGVGCGVVLCCV